MLATFMAWTKNQLTLVNIDAEDFERTKQMTFDLYVRYQTQIHNDRPADMCEFDNFICKSPIKVSSLFWLFSKDK